MFPTVTKRPPFPTITKRPPYTRKCDACGAQLVFYNTSDCTCEYCNKIHCRYNNDVTKRNDNIKYTGKSTGQFNIGFGYQAMYSPNTPTPPGNE